MEAANDRSSPQQSNTSQEGLEELTLMFRGLLKTIEMKFADVSHISTSEVEALMQDKSKQILLLDVREANEYEISHIPGSEHLAPDTTDFNKISEKVKGVIDGGQDAKIVCYCSLGYRSSAMAKKLAGTLKVDNGSIIEIANMRGGLFKWANENKEMKDIQGNCTIYAHPYNSLWGKFLRSNLRKWDYKNNL